jgi:exopolyphosphatase/pppGpp-phosphohydrolase
MKMTEPHWTGYVGMVAGIIGTITGVAGAIMGYVSYKRSNSHKSLDLRIDLKKAVSNVQSDLAQLEKLIEQANQSRVALAGVMGMLRSGMMEKWKQEIEVDNATVRHLVRNAPAANENYDDLTIKQLESRLVEVYRLQVQVDELRKKYEAALQADEEMRRQRMQNISLRYPPSH